MSVKLLHDTFEENNSDSVGSLVISTNEAGTVISIFQDDVWDLSNLFNTIHRQSTNIYFDGLRQSQKNEAKWLTYLLLKKTVSNRGHAIKPSTIILYYKSCIKPLIEFSKSNNCSIFETIENKQKLAKFAHQTQKPSQLSCLGAVLNHINNLGEEITKIRIDDICLVHQLTVLAKSQHTYQQHPIIPSRIYSSIINNLWIIVRDYWKNRREIHQLTIDISNDRGLADLCWDIAFGSRKHFIPLAKQYGLDKFFVKYNIGSVKQMVAYIRYVQNSGKYLIHAYTGMRDAEVLNLKTNCFEKMKNDSGYIATIEGETTKLVPNSLRVKWITSPELEEVINVATDILKLIKAVSNQQHDELLFLSTGYLGLATGEPEVKNQVPRLGQKNCPTKLFPEKIKILEEDLKELEKFDPFRNWLDDPKFKIGQKWHLNSHQFRRSLAVYATQSGLVSLPSLKRQFKHITKEMTLYYAKNSSMAENLLGINSNTPDHFLHYYHKVKPEVDAIAYMYEILLNEEHLAGAHGQWIEKHDKGKNILSNRQKTIDRFKNGQMAYKETALGGCTTVEPCDKKIMRSLTACIECSKAVIIPSKLTKVIDQNELLLNNLPKDSVEYKIEQDQLNHLINFQQRTQVKE